MKIKSLTAGFVLATGLIAFTGISQAACYHYQPGWHMVSKRCDIRPAANWQEYTSGVYTQPVQSNGFLFFR